MRAEKMTLISLLVFLLSILGIGDAVAGHVPRPLLERVPQDVTTMFSPEWISKFKVMASKAQGTAPFGRTTGNSTLHRNMSKSRTSFASAPTNSANQTGHYDYNAVNDIENLSEMCVLWDDNCSGNRTSALHDFFKLQFRYDNNFNGTMSDLTDDPCFMEWDRCEDNSPEQANVFRKIKDWMRSPQCMSSAFEHGQISNIPTSNVSEALRAKPPTLPGSCCGDGRVGVKNVDIFYWPEAEADTSCLSIVGDAVNPLALGASSSFEGGATYWGCTPKSGPMTMHNPQVAPQHHPFPVMQVYDVITTAVVVNYGTLKFKEWVVNPWKSIDCDDQKAQHLSQASVLGIDRRDEPRNMSARRPSMSMLSITQDDGSPIRTAVSGKFTFTSPSVYANFMGILASDNCGSTTLESTMLSFAPGELKTIVGPIRVDKQDNYEVKTKANYTGAMWASRPFDFRDLPCPPQSIMEENWYKPEKGEPYRPFIALPQKLRDALWFSNADDEFFTAYDPPHTLLPAHAMVPTTTAYVGDPISATQAPIPGPVQQDPAAPKTTPDPKPTVTPKQDPPPPDPKASNDPGPVIPAQPIAAPAQDPHNSQPKVSNVPVEDANNPPPIIPQKSAPNGANAPVFIPVNDNSGGSNMLAPGSSGQNPNNNPNPVNADSPKQVNKPDGSWNPSNAPPSSNAQGGNNVPAVDSQPMRVQDLGAIIASAMGKAPSTENQPNNAPGSSSSGNNGPGDSIPGSGNPESNAPINNAPAGNSPSNDPSLNSSPGNDVVGNYLPADNSPGKNAPVNNVPVGNSAPGSNAPTNSAPGNNSPGSNAPVNNAPSNNAPVVDSPHDDPLVGGSPSNDPQGTSSSNSGLPGADEPHVGPSPNGGVNPNKNLGVNVPVSIPPSQTAIVNGVVSQILNEGTPMNDGLITPNEAPAVTAAVVNAVQSGFAAGVTTVNNEIIKSIANNILAESKASPEEVNAPIPLGSSAVVIVAANSVDVGPVVKTFGSQAVAAQLAAVESVSYTLAAGGPAVTIGGTAMSLGTAGELVQDSKTIFVPTPTVALGGLIMDGFGQKVTTIADQVVTANPTQVEIGGSTIIPGAPGVTIGGKAVSLNTAGVLVLGSQTATLQRNPAVNSVATLANGAVVTAGGSPATIDGTVIAIPSDSNGLIVNGETIPLPTPTPTSIFTIGDQTFTAAATGFAIGSQTLSLNGPGITISNTPISLGDSGLQIGSSTIPLPSATPTSIFTIGGQAFTAAPGGFAVGSQTLSLNGPGITLSGTVISLGSSGLQIGSSTVPLRNATAQATGTTSPSATTSTSTSITDAAGVAATTDAEAGASSRLGIEAAGIGKVIATFIATLAMVLYI